MINMCSVSDLLLSLNEKHTSTPFNPIVRCYYNVYLFFKIKRYPHLIGMAIIKKNPCDNRLWC